MGINQALYEIGVSETLEPEKLEEQKEFTQLLDRQKGYARLYSHPEAIRLSQLRDKYPDFEQRYYETL
jgi:hypothetical protein